MYFYREKLNYEKLLRPYGKNTSMKSTGIMWLKICITCLFYNSNKPDKRVKSHIMRLLTYHTVCIISNTIEWHQGTISPWFHIQDVRCFLKYIQMEGVSVVRYHSYLVLVKKCSWKNEEFMLSRCFPFRELEIFLLHRIIDKFYLGKKQEKWQNVDRKISKIKK